MQRTDEILGRTWDARVELLRRWNGRAGWDA